MWKVGLSGGVVVWALVSALTGPVSASGDPLYRLTATAAIVVDDRTGEVVYARNSDLPLPPASTTKILTAYLALRSGQTDEHVVVSRNASQMQPSKIWLRPGWLMNVRDLIYAVLLNSANDASVVLAEGLAGSVPDFTALMNRTARRMGARNSNFVNPSGLPAEGHYSTARDLSIIMRHALALEPFEEALSTQQTLIYPRAGSRRAIALRSHNRLLNDPYTRVIGKTGWTREARRCFVGAAAEDGRRVIVSVLGSEDLWDDVRLLVDYAYGRATEPLAPQIASAAESAARAEERAAARAEERAAARAEERAAGRAEERPSSATNESDWRAAAAATLGDELRRERQRAAGSVREERNRQRSAIRYQVRLASFRSRAEASRFRQKVAAGGYQAMIQSLPARRNNVYHVTVGSFASRALAQKAALKFRKMYRVDPLVIATRT